MAKKKKGLFYKLKVHSVPVIFLLIAVAAALSVMLVSHVKSSNASRAEHDEEIASLSSRIEEAQTATTGAETTTTTTEAATTTTEEETTTTEEETTTTEEVITTTEPEKVKGWDAEPLSYVQISVDDAGVPHYKAADDYTKEYHAHYQSEYAKKKAENSDTYGWVRVQNTKIDYEIMHSDKDDFSHQYYLNRNYKKEYAKEGSIFADFRATKDFSQTRNFVLYGHCMSNGTMFRSVRYFFEGKYGTPDEIAKVLKVEITKDNKVYLYSVFSGYKSEGAKFIYYVNTTECSPSDFYEYLKGLQTSDSTKKVRVKQNLEFNEKSRITTLVTCTNAPGKPNERWVLHCLLTAVVELD